MRRLGRDELVYVIASALRKVRPAVRKAFTDSRHEVSDSGRVSMATTVADALARHEVMLNAPEANTPFSIAVDRMWGEDSGPPRMKEDWDANDHR